MTEPRIFFDHCYPLLNKWEISPYYWQRELFLRFCEGQFPTQIDLPTGTGKTSLMDVWFLALTWEAVKGTLKIPRRLVWVVNRRVVVDQATNRAMDIAARVANLPPEYRAALQSLSITGCEAPAISTLRGEKADNRAWTHDPSRPAIVIGTVDMIGSRILFSGYGNGAYFRPQHAGLLAVDTLIVNDEAHLTPAFVHLLDSISRRNPARHIEGKTFRYLSLSATHSGGESADQFPLSLEDDMAANETFRTRVTGYKRLSLHPVDDNQKLEAKIFELAIQPGAARTIVFVEKPEGALKMFKRIKKLHPDRVELLTGTMRGFERDSLLETPVLQAMISEKEPADPVWLVATSAGEVGIDITSERQISSLVSADRLIQRFGRLNRFGTGRGEAHLVYTVPTDKETILVKTLEYLQDLQDLDGGRDIRCLALRENPPGSDAQTGKPIMAELHDWLIELWCQTSDPVRGYPPVERWLHGLEESEGPETEIAWRDDIPDLTLERVTDEQRKLALRYYRVLAREKLREPTGRLRKKLELLSESYPDTMILVQRKDHSMEGLKLRDAVDDADLDYALILLPSGLGSLVHGMFEPSPSKDSDLPNDVADEISDKSERKRERWKGIRDENGMYKLTRLSSDAPESETLEDLKNSLKAFADRRGMRVMLQVPIALSKEDELPDQVLVYFRERPKRSSGNPVLLEAHTSEVSRIADELAERLVPHLAGTFRNAGRLHDTGKGRGIWQRAMGNTDASKKIAKPTRALKGAGALAGYRHELGSLVDARRPNAVDPSEDSKELLFHLIASHHGHARPHYPRNAHDAENFPDSVEAMVESVERFGRLIEDWGPWGLAYLEAIFKAADGIASRREEETGAVAGQPDDEHT